MLLRIPSEHRYYLPAESEGWDFLFVMLQGKAVDAYWQLLVNEGKAPLGKFALDHPAVHFLMDTYRECTSPGPGISNAYQGSAIAYRLLMELLRSSFQTADPVPAALDRIEPIERAGDRPYARQIRRAERPG